MISHYFSHFRVFKVFFAHSRGIEGILVILWLWEYYFNPFTGFGLFCLLEFSGVFCLFYYFRDIFGHLRGLGIICSL